MSCNLIFCPFQALDGLLGARGGEHHVAEANLESEDCAGLSRLPNFLILLRYHEASLKEIF